MPVRCVVTGAMGRMGRALIRAITESEEYALYGATERHDHPDIAKDVGVLPGLGPIQVRRALHRCGDPGEIAHRLSPAGLRALAGLGERSRDAILSLRGDLRQRSEDEVRRCDRLGIRLVPLTDPTYPAAFEAIPDAPILLYVRGTLHGGIVRIAVVGSRRATAYASACALRGYAAPTST